MTRVSSATGMTLPGLRGAVLLVVLLACTGPTDADPPRDTVELAARLAILRGVYGIPGMAAAIGCAGTVRWSAGFGSADVARDVPATPQTVFHVASLTKTFASIVLLQLVEEGRISLDDPVSHYGVELTGDVRVRHLMSTPAVTVHANATIRLAAKEMLARHIHRLVVVGDDGAPIGVVTPLDLLRSILEDPGERIS